MLRTPIVILTKDKPEQLHVTLKSLAGSNTYENPIVIVDDSSETQKGIDYLYTDKWLNAKFDDWTIDYNNIENIQEFSDKLAGESYLEIPKIDKIQGLSGRFTIVKTPRYLGRLYRILFGMNLAFTSYKQAKMCAILDDDIMFNPNWLKEAFKIYEYEHFKEKVGMICPFSEKSTDEEEAEYYMNGVVKGKAVLATRALYDAYSRAGIFRGIDVTGEGPAWTRLQKLGENLNLVCYTTRRSYIQSLEKRNLVNKDKVLMYDSNFAQPIAWNPDFT